MPQGHPLESGISPAAARTTEPRRGIDGAYEPCLADDDLELVNALEIEEA